jgi:hypothetical protein
MPSALVKAVILALLQRKFEQRGVFLALLMLLVAQFGAQLHSYAHRDAGAPDTPRQTMLVSHGACSDCLSFAPLLLTAGTPARLPRFSGQARTSAPTLFSRTLVDQASILAFRPRAPPLDQPA